MKETWELVRRCHALTYAQLPEAVVDRVRYLMLDYLGVAARGSMSDSSQSVRNVVSDRASRPKGAVVIGTDLKAEATYAALANGTFAHSIELDDVVNEASLHPGAVIMSTALAAAHIAGRGGRALIEGIVAGYETMTRLGSSLDPAAHYARGFHPTGTCGTLGAAITAAKILELNAPAATWALGIAGSQAAASMEFLSNGSFTKRFHPGWAAHSGIVAALLAREGFTGPETIIEGTCGFLKSYSPKGDPSSLFEDWGDPYKVMRTSVKPHACCRYMQGPIDGILNIMRQHPVAPSDVEDIELGILKAGFPIVAEPQAYKRNPQSIVDAQFSMPFGAAMAVLYGRASLEEYAVKNIVSPEVKQMMKRVRCVHAPEIEVDFPRKWPAVATLRTKSGEQFQSRIDYPKGDPENPLTWEEVIRKFEELTSPVFSDRARAEIVSHVRTIDEIDDIEIFSGLLSSS